MSLSTGERAARYIYQPAAWHDKEELRAWHLLRDRNYQATREWTDRNAHRWDTWFTGLSPTQRRRIRKKMHRDLNRQETTQ